MRQNLLKHSAIACLLAFGIAATAFAQYDNEPMRRKRRGQETKEAAKSAGEAGEHAGKAVAKGAKKTRPGGRGRREGKRRLGTKRPPIGQESRDARHDQRDVQGRNG